MKRILIWIGGGLGTVILLSALGGWFWMQQAMKPKPNEAVVADGLIALDIHWEATAFSDRAGLFLPVQLPGVDQTYYMQFDLGSELTLLYSPAFQSLIESGVIDAYERDAEEPGYALDVVFQIGGVETRFNRAPMIGYGRPVQDQPEDFQVIGTIGSDFARRKTLLIDFADSLFYAGEPEHFDAGSMSPAELRTVRGWVQTRVEMDGRDSWMMWDTGASAFRLITDETSWTKMANDPQSATSADMNSWGRTVTAHVARTDQRVIIGGRSIAIEEVAYMEGFPWYIQLLMRFSGMTGMLGNAAFQDHTVYVDLEQGQLGLAAGGTASEHLAD